MAKNPHFTFRVSPKVKSDFVEMARIYGAPSASAFAREIIEMIATGDIERSRAFTLRMAEKAGEQLKLSLNASFDEAAKAQKPANKARKSAGRGKPAPTPKKA